MRKQPSPDAPSMAAFAGVLALAIVLFYGDVVFGGRTFFYRDFTIFGYPLAQFHRESFWLGEVPLWNPYNCCGLPFLGQWNTLTLYPGTLLYLLLPMPWAVSFYCLLHLWWGGLGMYVWVWKTLRSPLGAGVAGMAFGLGGLMINSLMWPNNIAALGWMPWVVFAAERAWRRGGKWMAVAAVLGGVQMLTGAPEIILFTWMILGVLCMGEGGGGAQGWSVRVGRLAALGCLVAVIAAAQLLPFFHALEYSHRTEQFERGGWDLAWSGWANLILPLFRTLTNQAGICYQPNQFWTNTYYTGIGSIFLALVAVAHVRERRMKLLFLLSLMGVVLALGEKAFVLPWAERVMIPLQLARFPIKYVVFVSFCIPVLAAYGARWLVATETPAAAFRRVGWLFGGALTAVVVVLVVVQGVAPRPREDWGRVVTNGWTRVLLLLSVLGCLWAGRRFRFTGGWSIPIGLLGLLAVDQLSHEPNQNPSAPSWMLQPMVAETGDMEPMPRLGHSRAFTSNEASLRLFYGDTRDMYDIYLLSRLALSGNANLLDGIPMLPGFYSLYPHRSHYLRVLAVAFTNVVDCPFYDLLGISQTTRPGTDLEWLHRKTALPLLTVGQKPQFLTDQEMVNTFAETNYRPADVVFLPKDQEGLVSAEANPDARLLSQDVGRQVVRAVVETDKPVLLRHLTTYDAQWTAQVDGTPARVLQADFTFQAVEVPAGRHEVVLRYREPGLGMGLVASLVILGGCAWGLRPRCGSFRALD